MVRPSLKHALNALRWLMVGAPLALPIGMPLAANPFDASFTSFFRPATSTSLKMTKCGLSRLLSMACEVGTASISASDVREGISTSAASADMLVERFQGFASEVLMHPVHELMGR